MSDFVEYIKTNNNKLYEQMKEAAGGRLDISIYERFATYFEDTYPEISELWKGFSAPGSSGQTASSLDPGVGTAGSTAGTVAVAVSGAPPKASSSTSAGTHTAPPLGAPPSPPVGHSTADPHATEIETTALEVAESLKTTMDNYANILYAYPEAKTLLRTNVNDDTKFLRKITPQIVPQLQALVSKVSTSGKHSAVAKIQSDLDSVRAALSDCHTKVSDYDNKVEEVKQLTEQASKTAQELSDSQASHASDKKKWEGLAEQLRIAVTQAEQLRDDMERERDAKQSEVSAWENAFGNETDPGAAASARVLRTELETAEQALVDFKAGEHQTALDRISSLETDLNAWTTAFGTVDDAVTKAEYETVTKRVADLEQQLNDVARELTDNYTSNTEVATQVQDAIRSALEGIKSTLGATSSEASEIISAINSLKSAQQTAEDELASCKAKYGECQTLANEIIRALNANLGGDSSLDLSVSDYDQDERTSGANKVEDIVGLISAALDKARDAGKAEGASSGGESTGKSEEEVQELIEQAQSKTATEVKQAQQDACEKEIQRIKTDHQAELDARKSAMEALDDRNQELDTRNQELEKLLTKAGREFQDTIRKMGTTPVGRVAFLADKLATFAQDTLEHNIWLAELNHVLDPHIEVRGAKDGDNDELLDAPYNNGTFRGSKSASDFMMELKAKSWWSAFSGESSSPPPPPSSSSGTPPSGTSLPPSPEPEPEPEAEELQVPPPPPSSDPDADADADAEQLPVPPPPMQGQAVGVVSSKPGTTGTGVDSSMIVDELNKKGLGGDEVADILLVLTQEPYNIDPSALSEAFIKGNEDSAYTTLEAVKEFMGLSGGSRLSRPQSGGMADVYRYKAEKYRLKHERLLRKLNRRRY